MTDTIKLVSLGSGEWESEDKTVRVVLDHTFETYCDKEHPVRLRLDSLDNMSGWYKEKLLSLGKLTERRTKTGYVKYLSYLCPGDETHHYSLWTVEIDGDWTNDSYDDFKTALGVVERETGKKVKLVRRKKKRERVTMVDEMTGAAKWKRCGHRAELDINEDCYTCHESPLMEVA